MEYLRGREYQPRAFDHQRERLEAAAAELRAAGWKVSPPNAQYLSECHS